MTLQTLVTAEELAQHPSTRVELVEGVVTDMTPPGGRHGAIVASMASRMEAHARAYGAGRVLVETGFVLARRPDTVRSPEPWTAPMCCPGFRYTWRKSGNSPRHP